MKISSTDLGQQVATALLEDPRTGDAIINVANDRGMITLTGTVDSVEKRDAAEEIARQQSGVLTVINELKVE